MKKLTSLIFSFLLLPIIMIGVFNYDLLKVYADTKTGLYFEDETKVLDNPPIIIVFGSLVVDIELDSNYVDLGAVASDIEDGNITDQIITTNLVDTSVLDTYSVTYKVTDSIGNQTIETRTVNVIEYNKAGLYFEDDTKTGLYFEDETKILDENIPIISSVSVSNHPVKDGEVIITINFIEEGGLDFSVTPTVLVNGLATYPYFVTQTSYSGTTWTGIFTLLDNNEERVATVAVSNVFDLAENKMIDNNSAGSFNVDTISPNTPTINTVSSPTYNTNQTISGSKEINTSVLLNDSEIIGLNSDINWSYNLPLGVGTNDISISVMDSALNESGLVEASIVRQEEQVIIITPPSSGGGGGGGGGSYDNTAPSVNDIEIVKTSDTATLDWTTNESSISWVIYGETDNYGKEVKTTSYKTSHTIILKNLLVGTTYHFKIKTKDRHNNQKSTEDKTLITTPNIYMKVAQEKITQGGGGKIFFSKMMSDWNSVGTKETDLNSDDKVDKYDFSLLMLYWK